jgi:peptidoglycan/LPS O-acetylase OafA/YrhL
MYSQPKRMEFLDSVRGLAALIVLLSHTLGVFAWTSNYLYVLDLPFVNIFLMARRPWPCFLS